MPRNSKLQLESSRTSALLKMLNASWGESAFFVKIHGSPFQPRLVDILGCFFGHFVALEVKRPGNQPTPRQWITLDRIRMAGGFFAVVWSSEHIKSLLNNFLDSIENRAYLGITNPERSPSRRAKTKEIHQMPSAKTAKAKAGKAASVATKSSKKSAPVEDEEDELEDLDDLDELDDDDFEDDEEDADEEDEEDEPEPVKVTSKKAKNDAVAAKSSASKKASPVTSSKPAKTKATAEPAKARGNVGNLTPRRLAEGRAGAAQLADALGIEARAVRVLLRKNDEPKNDEGLYDFGAIGSKTFTALVKKYKALVA